MDRAYFVQRFGRLLLCKIDCNIRLFQLFSCLWEVTIEEEKEGTGAKNRWTAIELNLRAHTGAWSGRSFHQAQKVVSLRDRKKRRQGRLELALSGRHLSRSRVGLVGNQHGQEARQQDWSGDAQGNHKTMWPILHELRFVVCTMLIITVEYELCLLFQHLVFTSIHQRARTEHKERFMASTEVQTEKINCCRNVIWRTLTAAEKKKCAFCDRSAFFFCENFGDRAPVTVLHYV